MGVSYGSNPKWMVFSMDNPLNTFILSTCAASAKPLFGRRICVLPGWMKARLISF